MQSNKHTISLKAAREEESKRGQHNLVYGPDIPITVTIDGEDYHGTVSPLGDIRWNWSIDLPYKTAEYMVAMAMSSAEFFFFEDQCPSIADGDPRMCEGLKDDPVIQSLTDDQIFNGDFELKEDIFDRKTVWSNCPYHHTFYSPEVFASELEQYFEEEVINFDGPRYGDPEEEDDIEWSLA